MNKITASFTILSLVSAVSLISAAQVRAAFMEQHQSSSSDFSSDCTGTCHTSSSSSMSQDQFMSSDTGRGSNWGTRDHGNWGWDGGTSNTTADTSGEVTVRWTFRGGNCEIRYTEANARGYNYSTSTACDNGSLTIGGLVPGRAYRFQVRHDNGGWTRATRVVAR